MVVESEGGPRFHFAARVAWTLAYAGLDNVAILDGGHAAWTGVGKAVSTEPARRSPTNYKVKARNEYIATEEYVLSQLTSAQLLDVRNYDAYFGRTKLPFVSQFGHIPGAYSLPKEWFYDAKGLIIPRAEIEVMLKALGLSPDKELIAYCDTGMGCATIWWILHEQLGWSKVRDYDGSTEEISKNPKMKFNRYIWR